MGDARVLMDPILAAFGLPATVTRPAPDHAPVSTTAVWVSPRLEEQLPAGQDMQRGEPRRVLCLPRSALSKVPKNTRIVAAEESGGPSKTWRVEGPDRVEHDHWRLLVVEA